MLNMRHAEFWQSTPKEITELYQGFQVREQRHFESLAWLASHIINYTGHLKKAITPDTLLNRNSEKEKPKLSREDELLQLQRIEEEFNKAKSKHGAKS